MRITPETNYFKTGDQTCWLNKGTCSQQPVTVSSVCQGQIGQIVHVSAILVSYGSVYEYML